MLKAAIILLVILVCYLLMLQGRTGHPELSRFRGWSYAHRGLYGGTIPENSMAAFEAALENGYGIELDVHLLKDGTLAISHDSNLKRTTGRDVILEDLTLEDLNQYHLGGTDQTVPTFRQVLDLFAGKAPMIVELKTNWKNYAALCQAACRMLDGYDGPYCLESFDSRCVLWLRRHRPDLIRGQLAENFFARKSSVAFPFKILLTLQLGNFITRPDFIAYRYPDRKNPGVFLARKFWKLPGVSWTVQSQEEYDTAVKEGWIPIFEGFRP